MSQNCTPWTDIRVTDSKSILYGCRLSPKRDVRAATCVAAADAGGAVADGADAGGAGAGGVTSGAPCPPCGASPVSQAVWLAAWLVRTAGWCTPLHHLEEPFSSPPLRAMDASRARGLLRGGADLRADAAVGGPTPLSLASKM